MSTVIRATSPADLLSLVPALTGFAPNQSLVLIPFKGRRGNGALRFDLPGATSDLSAYASQAIGMLCRIPQIDAVAVFVYDRAPVDGEHLPHTALIEELHRRLEICGFNVVESLFVGEADWADYRSSAVQLHPLASVPELPAVAKLCEIAEDQAAGATLPSVDPEQRVAIAQALSEGIGSPPGDVPAFFEASIDSEASFDSQQMAALISFLNSPLLSVVALVQWARTASHGALALGANLARGASQSDVVTETLLGHGERPDSRRLLRALTLVRNACASAPDEHRSGALAAAGWLSWALGRSTHAGIYLAQALEHDPEHDLARALSKLVDHGILPEWAFVASPS